MRQPCNPLVMIKGDPNWRRIDSFAWRPGTTMALGNIILTRDSAYPPNLVVHGATGEPGPWYLASNLPEPHVIVHLYRRRMWLEEMFGDMKGHGFDLERSRLRHFLRLSRLPLAVCVLYVWLVARGEHALNAHFLLKLIVLAVMM